MCCDAMCCDAMRRRAAGKERAEGRWSQEAWKSGAEVEKVLRPCYGCLALVKLTSLGVMQSFPHTAASSCVGLTESKHQAASRGAHRPRTTARQVKVVVVTSGKGRKDPSQIVMLQRKGVAGRREGVRVSRRAAWTALHVFLVCLGWQDVRIGRPMQSPWTGASRRAGGGWSSIRLESIKKGSSGCCCCCLLFVVGGRVEPESELDFRSEVSRGWKSVGVHSLSGQVPGLVLSRLRLCLDRPALGSWLLAAAAFWSGDGGFWTDGGGRTGATGNGRRETERRGRPLVRCWKGTSAGETVAAGWQIGEISGLEWWVQEYVPRPPSLSQSLCLCLSVCLSSVCMVCVCVCVCACVSISLPSLKTYVCTVINQSINQSSGTLALDYLPANHFIQSIHPFRPFHPSPICPIPAAFPPSFHASRQAGKQPLFTFATIGLAPRHPK